MLCISGLVDDVMFAHNGQEYANATRKRRDLDLTSRPIIKVTRQGKGKVKVKVNGV